MIKEVVPLAEPLVAALVITFEDLDVALAPGVLISEYSELFGVGDMLLDLYATEVECATCLNSHQDFTTNFFKSFADAAQCLCSNLLLSRVFKVRAWSVHLVRTFLPRGSLDGSDESSYLRLINSFRISH